jgi:hypothetical protein
MDLRMSEDERQAFLAGVHIGVISIEREDGPRYFGAGLGDLYMESIKGEASLTWTMRPERWWSVDYSKTGRVDPRTP